MHECLAPAAAYRADLFRCCVFYTHGSVECRLSVAYRIVSWRFDGIMLTTNDCTLQTVLTHPNIQFTHSYSFLFIYLIWSILCILYSIYLYRSLLRRLEIQQQQHIVLYSGLYLNNDLITLLPLEDLYDPCAVASHRRSWLAPKETTKTNENFSSSTDFLMYDSTNFQ